MVEGKGQVLTPASEPAPDTATPPGLPVQSSPRPSPTLELYIPIGLAGICALKGSDKVNERQ